MWHGWEMARVSARTVLGVPALPPARVTSAGNRVRRAVGRVHAAMAPPPARILEGLFGLLDHRVLSVLCEAGVPDALVRRTTVDDLAARLGVDAEMLGRLLRFAANRGWVRIDRRGRVRPTRVTAFLRREHPGGWRAWVDFAGGGDIVDAVSALDLSGPRSGRDVDFFAQLAARPARAAAFNGAMAAGARMHGLAVNAAFGWKPGTRACDIGGGTGEFLRTLLELNPSMTGTVLDLPGVVAQAAPHERLTAVAGDAFTEVPSGFDVYFLVNVLHDWSDDDAVRILATTARAAVPTSRVIVVESDAAAWRHNDIAVSADVLMAALTEGGRERTTEEFDALGQSSGWRLADTVALASGDVAHEFELTR